jgi:two-component system, NarL family, response regulator LiaR
MEVLRIVLVDDYRMVTEALAARLSAAPDLWVAGCSQTDDPRLPEVIRWLRPDLVLIDVEPLGFAGAEVLGRIREAWPDARIIVVSADADASHAVAAARAGADAWVSKSQGADQLETVLRGVARGHSWFPPEMLGEVLRALRDDVRNAQESSNLLDTLSPRELDVLTSMAKGKRARQIAAELMISADTVRTHTRSIFGKLEVHSRIEAVTVAWAAGLRPDASPGPGPGPAGAAQRPGAGAAQQPGRGGQQRPGAGMAQRPGAVRGLPAGRLAAGGPLDRNAADRNAADRPATDRSPEGGQRQTRRAEPIRIGPSRARPIPAQSAGAGPASPAGPAGAADRRPSDSRPAPPQPDDSRPGSPGPADPWRGDPRSADSGSSAPRPAGPRPADPRRGDPRPADPRPADPRRGDPRRGDPRRGDPRRGDPRRGDSRAEDPGAGEAGDS